MCFCGFVGFFFGDLFVWFFIMLNWMLEEIKNEIFKVDR